VIAGAVLPGAQKRDFSSGARVPQLVPPLGFRHAADFRSPFGHHPIESARIISRFGRNDEKMLPMQTHSRYF
jgi:hypothetical protein